MGITFTIVVPMRDEEADVQETPCSLTRQDYPHDRFEIMVVDGGSSDASRDIVTRLAAQHPNIRLLDNPRGISAAARNLGVRAARGRFIGVVDCHSFVERAFLSTAERLFEHTRADCLGRPVELFIPTDSYVQRVIGAAHTSWLGHNLVSPRYGADRGAASPLSVGTLYRRHVFDRIGLFNEDFGACEDVEFNYRVQQAGMRTWSDPSLCCYYHPRPSLWALFQQLRRYAYWRYRLLRMRRRAFHPSQAVPAAALAVGGVAVAGAALGLVPVAPLLWAGAAYASVIVLASFRASRRRGLRYLPLLPAAFVAIHAGVAVGFWSAMLGDARAAVRRVWDACVGRLRDRRVGCAD